MQRFGKLALSMLLVGCFGTAVYAQAILFDRDRLRAACLGGQCEISLMSELQQLQQSRIETADFNSQIGAMASLLFELVPQANPSAASGIARALTILAGFSSDAAQQASLLQLANAVANGDTALFDLDAPFAASPN